MVLPSDYLVNFLNQNIITTQPIILAPYLPYFWHNSLPKKCILLLHYPDVYQPCQPVILQLTQVPNSLPMGANYVDYEPQGTEVIQACLQTTP